MASRIATIAAAIALGMASAPALAQTVEFKLINESSHTITYFYASPSDESNWGDDLFDELGVLEPGYNVSVTLGADGNCLYDFRFETAEGAELDEYEVNVCELESYTVSN